MDRVNSCGIDHEAEKFGGHIIALRIGAVTTVSTCVMPRESSAYTFYTRTLPSVLCLLTRPLGEA